jgi:hypothetical protein
MTTNFAYIAKSNYCNSGSNIKAGEFTAYAFPGKSKERFPWTVINKLPYFRNRLQPCHACVLLFYRM